MARATWLTRAGVPGRYVRRRSPEPTEQRGRPVAGHLIVCGDDPLTYRLASELVTQHGRQVTVILPNRRRNHGPQISRLAVRVIESERLDADAFRRARVATADAVAVMRQDDVGNIHVALQAQELNPRVHLVLRMFNLGLGLGVRTLFHDCVVLSDAAMAAPAFVAEALGEAAPVQVRLSGRRALHVVAREAVPESRIVCALADTRGDRTVLLPRDPASANLVLALADTDDEPTTPPRRKARPWAAIVLIANRKLVQAALALVVLLIAGTGVLAMVRGDLTWYDAAYLTILAALGGADANVDAGAVEKILQTMLTVVSIALIPVVTAAVVEAVVNARLAIALGGLRDPVSDHVVVVGLGNVGTRVIRQLHQRGIQVVAIDKTDDARGAALARELDVPLIVGDASREEILRAASVQTCRALVVLSTDDVVNLEAALHGRALNAGVRVVLRLFDGDFADRVERAFRIDVSRSVSYLAAPAFAAAMLQRDVIGAIPVNRRVLLIADLPVCAGSAAVGARIGTLNAMDGVRVIAVTHSGSTTWSPGADRQVHVDDRLLLVTTRDGLGRVVAATSA
ncbi:NAD-binding protein [Virgisporangium aurantiacum]|uniref:Potassium transporter TrkA n=1 Tax=Virgisporangium aurantiacum TaxID=175570 RepID=A0A8J4DY11_9ACTN|nr:NAD-binding protein [Virgisporangium aurantiacum]GIJ53953.1 potassium transporter TrkA [Virgisporangium aurantiacum]